MDIHTLFTVSVLIQYAWGQNRDASLRGGHFKAVVLSHVASKEERTVALIDRLLKSSDPAIRPKSNGGPIEVSMDLYVQNFGPLNEKDMEFSVEIFLRKQWNNPALSFTEQDDPLFIPHRHSTSMWMPDLYFPNAVSASHHNVLQRNGVTIIFPNGTVYVSLRLTLHLHCSMYLDYFPFDHQECTIQIGSYALPNDTLTLKWKEEDPIEITEDLDLPQFELIHKYASKIVQSFKTGSYDCLEATFQFRRLVGYYLLQNYLPCFLIVMLSWVSFWISRESIAARISLGVTTVLTLTTQLNTFRDAVQVSYPKAIDTWYTICNTFVFGALLEFMVVNILSRREKEAMKPYREAESTYCDELDTEQDTASDIWYPCQGRCNVITSKNVDACSRLMFPLLYICISAVYWGYYIKLKI